MKKTIMAGALGTATAIALALPAAAQNIDYGALEDVFGEPVTTSATGKPQRVSEAPVTMEIITAEDIKRSGVDNVPDILQRVVGLDVLRSGFAQADVAVRGYKVPQNPRLLVLVDGRQVYLDHYGMTNWNALPVQLAEIRQIEVVKGPNSALFGFNAVAGVVNIVTYSPLYDNVNNFTVRYGTQRDREVSGVATLKLGENAGIRLSLGGFNATEYDTAIDRNNVNIRSARPSRRSFNVSGLAKITPELTVGAEVSNVLSKMATFISAYSFSSGNYDIWSGKFTATADTGIGQIGLTAYQNMTDVDAGGGTTSFDNTVRVIQLQDLFKIGTDHSFRISGEYRRNSLENIARTGAEVAYDVFSLGAMWDWTISEKLSLVNAVRLDHLRLERSGSFIGLPVYTNDDFNRQVTEPSFNTGLVYKVTDDDTVRLAVARGIQVPGMWEYGNMQAFGNSVMLGNPEIDPTIVTNYEVSYNRTLAEIDGGVRAALYYQTNEDVKAGTRTVARSGVRTASAYENFGDSSAVGFEATVHGKLWEDLSWKFSYAFESINDQIEPWARTVQNFEDSTPSHKLNGEISYDIGRWDFNLFGQYTSASKMLRAGATPNPRDIPSAFTLAGKVGYEVFDGVTAAVTGINITQAAQRLTSAYPEERRVFLTLSANF